MNIIINVSYFIVALIWNIAILSAIVFLSCFLIDILGSIFENKFMKDGSYVIAMLATVSFFWFGIAAGLLSNFIKCGECGSRFITLRDAANAMAKKHP